MKFQRGDLGYLQEVKKRERILCGIQWGAVIAFLITGILATKSRLNWFTLIAILSCLPAAKTTVGVIVKWTKKPIEPALVEEIEMYTEDLAVAYNLILTSNEKVMPIACMVAYDQTVYGYVTDEKVDVNQATAYIKKILGQQNFQKTTVKLFTEFKPFLARVEGMKRIAEIHSTQNEVVTAEIKHAICLYSM